MSSLKKFMRSRFPRLATYRAYLRGKAILPEKVLEQAAALNESGVTAEKRETPLVVSLTSFPERIEEVGCAVYSLMRQTCKPDRIVLWLADEEFPSRDVPDLLRWLEELGLEIRWTPRNWGPYGKLIPSLEAFPDAAVVVCDDDAYYREGWLEKLYAAWVEDLEKGVGGRCYAHRARRIKLTEDGDVAPFERWPFASPSSSVLNSTLGVGGVLFPPGRLHPDATKEELFMTLCPKADDLWAWAMTVLSGGLPTVVESPMDRIVAVNYLRDKGAVESSRLCDFNVEEGGNDRQMRALLERYPELLRKIREAAEEEASS